MRRSSFIRSSTIAAPTTMTPSPLPPLLNASQRNTVETVLSARRIDVDDQAQLAAACEHASIARAAMQAMLEALRPLSRSLEVYVTR
jgi:hypothetical protein